MTTKYVSWYCQMFPGGQTALKLRTTGIDRDMEECSPKVDDSCLGMVRFRGTFFINLFCIFECRIYKVHTLRWWVKHECCLILLLFNLWNQRPNSSPSILYSRPHEELLIQTSFACEQLASSKSTTDVGFLSFLQLFTPGENGRINNLLPQGKQNGAVFV